MEMLPCWEPVRGEGKPAWWRIIQYLLGERMRTGVLAELLEFFGGGASCRLGKKSFPGLLVPFWGTKILILKHV